jgi:hypothetical protein
MEISIFFQIFKNWWWIFFPVVFYLPFRFFYFWWVRWEVYYKKAFKWILLEIKPPKEILKPFSAMENVFSLLAGIIDDPNWRERWCNGALFPIAYGGWFSFEICSFGGEIHFYLRIPEFFRLSAESAIYSQYPEAEISLVEDYTKRVPKDIPNEKWDLYSEDYTLVNENHYPIRTYTMFFEKEIEEKRVIEEKRLDPLDSLLESLSKIQSGEQIWFQICCVPIFESQFPWIKKGRAEADRIAKRPPPPPEETIIDKLIQILFPGSKKGKKEASMELIAPELRLTPGEKEILTAIENKIKKQGFACWIKQVYICKKDEPHNPGNARIIRGYMMNQFSAPNLNSFVFYGATRTRIHYWIKSRRLYLRKRQRLREAIERIPSFFPWNITGNPPPLVKFLIPFGYRILPGKKSVGVLNVEELATIFHLPIHIYVPTVPRVETKKVGPPPGLPTE